MLVKSAENAIAIEAVVFNDQAWFDQQNAATTKWLELSGFSAKPGQVALLADESGAPKKVLLGIQSPDDFMSFGVLARQLKSGSYKLDGTWSSEQQQRIASAWLLGAYQFDRYKESPKINAQLVVGDAIDVELTTEMISSVDLVRDLINTPTDDMGPEQLAQVSSDLAKECGASFAEIVGDDLLAKNYPTIHAVGRACERPPRLIDLRWGDESAPKVTLVGKGVCFDTGGLNIKPSSGMRYMKKDMAGAAHVLGLARMIMKAGLPVRLRVLIPAVENSVSGRSYHPGDIIKTRKGTTVEITNTDAEGRLVLCDALNEACSENPDLLVDVATLTGAARVAVGTDISAMFTNDDQLADDLYKAGEKVADPIWRLPMYEPYRKLLESPVADMVNSVLGDPYGAAITAALFLSEFVPEDIRWVHFDIMAWNKTTAPGRPEGGEAMAIRALYECIALQYQK